MASKLLLIKRLLAKTWTTTAVRYKNDSIVDRAAFVNLREFFEENEDNLDVSELRPKDRPGRAWSMDELRLKSSSDLHKLWYVLLKERNMLLTMRHLRERTGNYFPNPERLDKVKESMENLEAVVHERNDAVLRLETGDGASPPMRTVTSFAGFTHEKQAQEHHKPSEETRTKEYEMPFLDDTRYLMQKLWEEKQVMKKRVFDDDEYLRLMAKNEKNIYKRSHRRTFDRVEQLPETIVKNSKETTSQ